MADRATLQMRLAKAEEAYDALMNGRREVELTYASGDGSRTVKYTPASADRLKGYIAELKQQLGLTRRGAIGVRFS